MEAVERWKKIDHEKYILVSNRGRAYNKETKKYIGYVKHYGDIDYKCISLDHKDVKMHRLIASVFIPNPDNKEFVDHIDNNGLNNHVSNLRWATNQENNRNQKLSKTNLLGVKGIQQRPSGSFRVRIRINGILVNVGSFKTLNEAIEARKQSANDNFGEFTNECEKY